MKKIPLLAMLLLASLSPRALPQAASDHTPADSSASNRAAVIAGTNSMDVLDDRRPLGNGDTVNFRIVEDRKPPITLQITDSGELEVPMIGRVKAAGVTSKALAHTIKRELEKRYYNRATVIVGLDSISQATRGRVYVTGQVNTVGPLDIPPNEELTVSKAIIKAGGFADFANTRRVRVFRKKSDGTTERLIVDIKEVVEKGHLEKDIVLKPEDYIVVPERAINF